MIINILEIQCNIDRNFCTFWNKHFTINFHYFIDCNQFGHLRKLYSYLINQYYYYTSSLKHKILRVQHIDNILNVYHTKNICYCLLPIYYIMHSFWHIFISCIIVNCGFVDKGNKLNWTLLSIFNQICRIHENCIHNLKLACPFIP